MGMNIVPQALRDKSVAPLHFYFQLQQELQVQQNKISREIRLKEKLDKEIQQLHTDMEAKMAEIKALNIQGQKAKEEQQRLEQQLKDLKVSRGGRTLTLICYHHNSHILQFVLIQ